MTTIETQSLYDALNTCMVSELPEPLKGDESTIWVKGIVKVKKNDLSTNWAIVRNDGYGNPKIIQDFGRPAIIVEIGEVHPTQWMSGEDMPVLRSKTDMTSYLVMHGEDKDKIKEILSDKNKTKEEIEKCHKDIMAMIINYAEEDIENKRLRKEHEDEIYQNRFKEAEEGTGEQA